MHSNFRRLMAVRLQLGIVRCWDKCEVLRGPPYCPNMALSIREGMWHPASITRRERRGAATGLRRHPRWRRRAPLALSFPITSAIRARRSRLPGRPSGPCELRASRSRCPASASGSASGCPPARDDSSRRDSRLAGDELIGRHAGEIQRRQARLRRRPRVARPAVAVKAGWATARLT
jgi:hypothetical protein